MSFGEFKNQCVPLIPIVVGIEAGHFDLGDFDVQLRNLIGQAVHFPYDIVHVGIDIGLGVTDVGAQLVEGAGQILRCRDQVSSLNVSGRVVGEILPSVP